MIAVSAVLIQSVGVDEAAPAVIFVKAGTVPLKVKSLMENVVPPAEAPHTYKRNLIFALIFCNDAPVRLNVAPVVDVLVPILAA